jgi:hypothetical protein
MRTTLATLIALSACSSARLHAVEFHSEATVGRDFAYFANEVVGELVDGQLGLSGGLIMVSDLIN